MSMINALSGASGIGNMVGSVASMQAMTSASNWAQGKMTQMSIESQMTSAKDGMEVSEASGVAKLMQAIGSASENASGTK